MNYQAISQVEAKGTVVPPLVGGLHRACACGQHTRGGGQCEECSKQKLAEQSTGDLFLQRRASTPGLRDTAPPIVLEVLRSPGKPLDANTRAFFEPRFGQDFSSVRVHDDARAAESASAVDALAYTVGRHIHFGSGQYDPSTTEGKKLLAHELTHVTQQRYTADVGIRSIKFDPPGSAQEAEAERVAASVFNGSNSRDVGTSHCLSLQRQGTSTASTPCPNSSSLDTFLQFNHDDLPAAQKANFRTYLGVLVRHGLSPGPDHTGHCIREELATISSDCPAALTAATNPCSRSECLPINRRGQDEPTGTFLASSRQAFLDIHRSRSPRSLLDGTGVNSCQVICEQKYHCDSSGAPVLGMYRITRNYEASTFAPPGGVPVHITTGSVDKVEAFGPGDFPLENPEGDRAV